MKKILITGGAGFIGSHLIKRLVNVGYDVIVIDNLERGCKENIESVLDKITFLKLDLRDYDSTVKYFKNIDVVIHLASKVGGIGTYTSQPYKILSNNILIDSNVLRAVLENGVNKYFYASSAHVYPKQLQKTKDSPKMLEENVYPADCELSYGWGKLIGEKQIEYAVKEHPNFNAAIARFIGIYGTNQDYELETGSVIPVFSHRAIKYPEVPFNVWGDGTETRSYCFIDDTLDCIELMVGGLETMRLTNVNVGKEERNSITEIAESIINISNKNIIIDYDKTNPTKIWGQWCDCSLVEKLYDWRATTSLNDGLKVVYNDIKERLGYE